MDSKENIDKEDIEQEEGETSTEEEYEATESEVSYRPMEPIVEDVDEPAETVEVVKDGREDLAAKFKKRQDKEEEVEEEVGFVATDPGVKKKPWLAIILIGLIIFSLIAIVWLVMTTGAGAGGENIRQTVVAYNQQKSIFDQNFVSAVNKLIEAEANFNAKEYATANDKAKSAEDNFSQSLDYLFDLKNVEFSGEFDFMAEYYNDLEDVSDLGEKMSNSLAYAARSADRGQADETSQALQEYNNYASDMEDATAKLEKIKSQHPEFFGEV